MDAQSDNQLAAGRPVINDCWNKIGVYGDRSCPELVAHAHCRNCPVYSASALRVLDRELPPLYVKDWTAHFAQAKQVVEQNTHSAVIFRIGADWLALPAQALDEVTELRPVRTLPHRRNGIVLGLVNVRGELIICVSLGKLLNLADASEGDASAIGRLIVMNHEGRRMAFPVDEVLRTTRYRPQELGAVPATIAHAAANHTKGILSWNDRLVACLDEHVLVRSLDRSVA